MLKNKKNSIGTEKYFFLSILLLVLLLLTSGQAQASRKKKTENKIAEIKAVEDKKNTSSEDQEKLDLVQIQILNDFFKLKKENLDLAIQKINQWQPQRKEDTYYKEFFIAQLQTSTEPFWKLYKDLKKSKKLLRVQLETLKSILDLDLSADSKETKFVLPLQEFKKEAKSMVRRMNSLPEGLDFELKFLRWVRKYQISDELCKSERRRWLAQTAINFSEVSAGLKSCPLTFDDFTYRMRMLIFSGEEKKALEEVSLFKDSEKLMDWQKAYLQAIFYSNVGDPVAAFKEVKNYESEILASKDYYDNLFYIAQRAGELDKAEDLVTKIIKNAKSAKEAKEFRFQKAFLYYQTRRYKEAVLLLNELIKKNPSLKAKRKKNDFDDLTWLKAWCLYLDKNFIEARKNFAANKEWTRDKARNLYWLAQTEWALENQVTALDYFKQLAQPLLKGEFFNYYNFLGWLRFDSYKSLVKNNLLDNQIALMKSGRGPYLLPDDQTNPMRIVREYKTYFEDMTQTDEGDIQIINQDAVVAQQSDINEIAIEGKSDLKRQIKWADAMISWGYPDFAKWHLYEVEKSLKKRNTADPLVMHYLEKNQNNRALSLMQKLSSPQQKKLSLREDDLMWKAFYPRAFQLNVSAESTLRKINPNLIWSIMKAETQYKQDAISPVGAVGLMQFMPYTSQKVALLLKDKAQTQELFKPEIAIQYGAAYLKKLSVEFGDQLPLVAAAYNGGPHRVKLWLRNFGEIDFDVFIEHIPFAETRTYVKRVLSFYATYQKIYDEKIDPKKMRFLIEKNPYVIKEPISLKEEWDIAIK